MLLNIAQVVPCTEAEGPGKRFAIWFQGCPLRCPGCCNPEMLPFSGGQKVELEDLILQIQTARREQNIEGITIMGGEPTSHALVAWALSQQVKWLGLSVMVFSGYTLEQIKAKDDFHINSFLAQIDILVDGPYMRDLPDTKRRWIGSTNQRIHFLTDRYKADDPCWDVHNTLEIRLHDGTVMINGFPGKQAVGLWKRGNQKSQSNQWDN